MTGLGCTDLPALKAHIGECTRCPLSAQRTQVVFGVGDPGARVMLIGEGPGKNEDLKGEPFVGAAGKLLNELLSHAGLERGEVYIANVVKCRPPGNRDPEAFEIETCTPFLREQIRLIQPQVLVTLGNFATKYVLKTAVGITRLHGTIQHAGRFTVLPIFHPAAAIYDNTKRDALFADFERLGALLAEMDAERAASAGGASGGGASTSAGLVAGHIVAPEPDGSDQLALDEPLPEGAVGSCEPNEDAEPVASVAPAGAAGHEAGHEAERDAEHEAEQQRLF